MDPYASYGLLPRPPATVFSDPGTEATRFRFPDFTHESDPAEALRQWIRPLFFWSAPDYYIVQVKVTSTLLIVIILLGAAVVGRRIWERSFWLFRIVRRTDGIMIVPNAITTFVCIEGCYGVLLVAFLWTIVVYFDQEHNPWRIMLWISCVWCPLVTGAIWAGWGTLHATPSAFSKPSISSSGRRHVVRSFIRKPWVINILCLSTPVLQFVSVMIPGIIANARTDSALQMYLDWLDRYGTATELSPDMLREAQQLWFKAASGAYISAVLMTIWSAWAGVFLIFYGLTGAFLIRIVRRQISRIRSLERKQNALDPYRAETPPSANFKHKSGLDSDGVMFTRQQIESDLPHTSFFPSIKPSGVIKSTPKAKSSPSVLMAAVGRKKAHPRARYLEKVNKNFSVQYSGIVSATAAFTGLAIYWSCSIYDAYEHNTVGALFMRAILWASWASCLFGGICFLAIVTRTFEPLVQTLTQSSDEEKRSRERLSGGQLPSPRYIEQGKLPLTLAEPPRQYRGRRRGNTSSGRDSLARNSVNSYSELEDHEMVGVRGASTGSPQDREAVAGQRAHRGLGIDGPMEHLVDQDIPFASTPYVASPPEAATSGFLVEQTVEHSYEQNSLKALRRPLPTMRSGDLGYPPSSPISPASFGSPATPMTPATPYMPNSQAPLLSPTSPGWPVWDQAKYDRAASRHGATGTGTSFGERAVERFGLGIRRPRTTESFVEENTVELPLSPIEIPEQADRAERRPAWLPPAEWGSPDLAEELIIEERERARARQNSPNDSQTSFHTSTLELSSSLHHHGSSS